MACVGNTSANPEIKILHLRQYLKGEALATVESLGFTASSYQAAIARLDRKCGGSRRQVAIYLEEIDAFPAMKQGKASELQRFADIIDVAVVNLKDSGKAYELQDGVLYSKLQAKLSTSMLTQYNRWWHNQQKSPHVETLLEWVNLEAEFATDAVETIEGIGKPQNTKPQRREGTQRTFHSSDASPSGGSAKSTKSLVCASCRGDHPVWKCKAFKDSTVTQRWNVAKRAGLCYRCLASGHSDKTCTWGKTCGVEGCSDRHNRLLHGASSSGSELPSTSSSSTSSDQVTCCTTSVPASDENDGDTAAVSTYVETKPRMCVSLRTVPVVLSNGNRKVQVNAMLDDGSTASYVSSAVAAELGVQSPPKHVTVCVLNGVTKSLHLWKYLSVCRVWTGH